MTDHQDRRMTLVYEGIRLINHIVTSLPMAEAHVAVDTLRAHLDSRSKQTAAVQPESVEDLL